MLRRTGKLH